MGIWLTYIDEFFEILIPASADKYGWVITYLFIFSPVWFDVFSRFRRHHLPHHSVGPDGDEPRSGDQVQRSGDGDGHCGHHQPGGHSDTRWNLRRCGVVADWARYRNTYHYILLKGMASWPSCEVVKSVKRTAELTEMTTQWIRLKTENVGNYK